ncbi:ATP-binding protein [Actinomadura kijaniata]|uniref:ATP-binding protein n=1 Tax=Actinomadura kijaniata TaxID=46161 RepID=UPI000A5902B9|nr:ATP-binding protein [Actinomadura kijaniata]
MPDPRRASWPLRDETEFACLPSAARWARKHLRDILTRWRMPDLTDTAELLVSELITNAYRAAGVDVEQHGYTSLIGVPPIQMRLSSNHHRLLIEVWDSSLQPPIAKPTALDAETGRGLHLVKALSHRWNYFFPTTGGKVVWCELLDTQAWIAGESKTKELL